MGIETTIIPQNIDLSDEVDNITIVYTDKLHSSHRIIRHNASYTLSYTITSTSYIIPPKSGTITFTMPIAGITQWIIDTNASTAIDLTLTISDDNGTIATQTVTTSSTGTGTFSFPDLYLPPGTYTITADTSSGAYIQYISTPYAGDFFTANGIPCGGDLSFGNVLRGVTARRIIVYSGEVFIISNYAKETISGDVTFSEPTQVFWNTEDDIDLIVFP